MLMRSFQVVNIRKSALMNTVFVSATGKYLQGDLTPQIFRDLVESYDPAIYEAGAFVAHSTKWAEAGINEPPRLAAVKSLSDGFVDHSGRVYLSAGIEETADYAEAQQYFPHKSIEFWDSKDPRNPLNQDHIPAEKRGRPYFRGFALLGDSPAAKLPGKITKFFGPLTDEKRQELSRYADAAAGLYCYDDSSRTKPAENMKTIARACGLPDDATEDQIVAKIGEMKGKKTPKQYEDEITALASKVETLERAAGDSVKEYSDKLTASEARVKTLETALHTEKVAGFVREAQGKNLTIGADKLDRLRTYADRDYRDGDEKYTLAKAFLEDIPTVKPASVGKVSGSAGDDEDLKKVRCFADLASDADLRARYAEAYPEQYEQLVLNPGMKI